MKIPSVNKTAQITLKSLTRVFKKQIYDHSITYNKLENIAQNAIIGSLPKEIIHKIEAISTSKTHKDIIIKSVIASLDKIAKHLVPSYDTLPVSEFSGMSKLNNSELSKLIINKRMLKFQALAKKQEKILTADFYNLGLLKNPTSKVTITPLGEGAFGIGYKIDFPEELKCKPKVLKVFKTKKLNPKIKEIHGLLAEANSAMYISKNFGQNFERSLYAQGYLCTIKGNFILCEHANNYPKHPLKRTPSVSLNVKCNDFNYANIINQRIVDYGATKHLTPNINRAEERYFNKLYNEFLRSYRYDNPKKSSKFIDLLKTYHIAAIENKAPQASDLKAALKRILNLLPENLTEQLTSLINNHKNL